MSIETTVASSVPRGVGRRTSAFFNTHRAAKLGVTLGIPLLWIGVIYLGALTLLFMNAFWRVDTLSGSIVKRTPEISAGTRRCTMTAMSAARWSAPRC